LGVVANFINDIIEVSKGVGLGNKLPRYLKRWLISVFQNVGSDKLGNHSSRYLKAK
jgi:hypothetical protein